MSKSLKTKFYILAVLISVSLSLQVYDAIIDEFHLVSIIMLLSSVPLIIVSTTLIKLQFKKEEREKDALFSRLSLLDSSIDSFDNVSFSITDKDGKFIYINQEVVNEYPNIISKENILGKTMIDIEDAPEMRRVHASNLEIIKTGKSIKGFIDFRGKKYHLSKFPLFNNKNECVAVVTLFVRVDA